VFGGRQGAGGLPSTSYSISDGQYGGSEGKFKRELSKTLAQPWPNDKHWDSQHYESRELGANNPYLF
jgi:hypothetical protein